MKRTPWFRSWFGEDYLALYPHRDEAEANQAVDLLQDVLQTRTTDHILDLACGGGRHLAELSRRGYEAVGLDLSIPMLTAARSNAPTSPLVRGDMRSLPFAERSFDLVTSFFTSFGYFSDPYDDVRVLREVHRVLRPGGGYLLDFLNADEVRANLEARDERVVDGNRVTQERRISDCGKRVEKRITITSGTTGTDRVFSERVRLYEPDELDAALEAAHLKPTVRLGSYDGDDFGVGAPRYIVLGRAQD